MPAFSSFIAVAGLAAQASASRQLAASQREMVNAQKGAAAENRKAQEVQYRRQQRQAIRQAQLARAQSSVTAGAVGGGTSSGLAGGLGALGSSLGGNLGFGSQLSGINANIGMYNQRALDAQVQQQNAQSLFNLGGTLFSFGTSNGAFSSLFGPKPTPIQTPTYTTGAP